MSFKVPPIPRHAVIPWFHPCDPFATPGTGGAGAAAGTVHSQFSWQGTLQLKLEQGAAQASCCSV